MSRCTVAKHEEFLAGILGPDDLDEIESLVDPYAGDPPCRRSDKEVNRVLALLDSLETERGSE